MTASLSLAPIACRRCSECRGESHHWLEESAPPPPNGDGFNGYVCKHCETRAEMCDDCGGAVEPGHVCEDEEGGDLEEQLDSALLPGVTPAATCVKCNEPAHDHFMAAYDAAPGLWDMPCSAGGVHEWRRDLVGFALADSTPRADGSHDVVIAVGNSRACVACGCTDDLLETRPMCRDGARCHSRDSATWQPGMWRGESIATTKHVMTGAAPVKTNAKDGAA
jgi:hypothetical protein